jgi:hypothetical protein
MRQHGEELVYMGISDIGLRHCKTSLSFLGVIAIEKKYDKSSAVRS